MSVRVCPGLETTDHCPVRLKHSVSHSLQYNLLQHQGVNDLPRGVTDMPQVVNDDVYGSVRANDVTTAAMLGTILNLKYKTHEQQSL